MFNVVTSVMPELTFYRRKVSSKHISTHIIFTVFDKTLDVKSKLMYYIALFYLVHI